MLQVCAVTQAALSTNYSGWPDNAVYDWSNKSTCWTEDRWQQIAQCKTNNLNPTCLVPTASNATASQRIAHTASMAPHLVSMAPHLVPVCLRWVHMVSHTSFTAFSLRLTLLCTQDDLAHMCSGTVGSCQAGACEFCVPIVDYESCSAYYLPKYPLNVTQAMCNCSDNGVDVPGSQTQPGSCVFGAAIGGSYRSTCKSSTVDGLPAFAIAGKKVDVQQTDSFNQHPMKLMKGYDFPWTYGIWPSMITALCQARANGTDLPEICKRTHIASSHDTFTARLKTYSNVGGRVVD